MQLSIKYTGSKLTASISNKIYFQGRIKKKFWKDIWILLDNSKKELARYTINSKYFVYDFKMSISISGEMFGTLNYRNKRPHFTFENTGSSYQIVFHKGNKISFFKNEKQFALMKKKSVSGWSGQEFMILTDDDTNLSFLMILVYAILITNYDEPDGDSDFTIDLGSFNKELQPFDGNWQPNNILNS